MNNGATIVLSAFVIHPDLPSEPGVGWNFAVTYEEYARATKRSLKIVTNERSAVAIREWATAHAVEVEAVPVRPQFKFFRWSAPRFTRFEHLLWARRARRAVTESVNVAWAHHVTFASEILPPPFRRNPGFPTFWGPVGAGGNRDVFRVRPIPRRGRWHYLLQALRDASSYRLFRWASRNSDVVLAQNESLKIRDNALDTVFPNVVVPEQSVRPGTADIPNSVVVVGHYIPRKRLELIVDALVDPRMLDWSLHLVGPPVGRGFEDLVRLIDHLGLTDRVKHHGALPRQDVLALMSRCSVLAHLSAREGASGVVGEATSVGLPVVCFERTGAASVLKDQESSGVVLRAHPRSMREEIAGAILEAATLPRTRAHWGRDRILRRIRMIEAAAEGLREQ